MRVGFVTPRYPPNVEGGGERSVKLVAEQVATHPRVDRVVVFSFDGTSTEERNGVEVRRLGEVSSTVTELQNLHAAVLLRGELDGIDVLHGYNMELHPTVGVLGSKRVGATVATLNSYHFLPKSVSNTEPSLPERLYELLGHPTTGRLMMHAMKRIDAFVALSSAVRDLYVDHGLPAEKVEVIPNMLDPAFSVPDRESEPGTSLLYVGTLVAHKGVDDLVRALTKLPEEYSLTVVGDGPERGALERLAADLGAADRVTFTGRIDYEDVAEAYATADVFVHPGVWPEPFPRTVLEAMKAALPVVSTDLGGMRDVVRQPELRCPPNDPAALAEAIRAATQKSGIGERNREYVEENFTPDVVTDRIVDLYERVRDGGG